MDRYGLQQRVQCDGAVHGHRLVPTGDAEIRDGDGEMAGVGQRHGFMQFDDPQKAVEYGAAHGALAMTTPGDTSMASFKEVEALVNGGNARVQR